MTSWRSSSQAYPTRGSTKVPLAIGLCGKNWRSRSARNKGLHADVTRFGFSLGRRGNGDVDRKLRCKRQSVEGALTKLAPPPCDVEGPHAIAQRLHVLADEPRLGLERRSNRPGHH